VHAEDNRNLKNIAPDLAVRREVTETLREQGASAEELVESIAKTSDTFSNKTAMSQKKYIRTKKARLVKRIQLLPASPADIAHSHRHRAETGKPGVVAVRADMLGLMLCHANLGTGGSALVVDESGGGVAYAVWRKIGSGGRLVLPYAGKLWMPLFDTAPPSAATGSRDTHVAGTMLPWRQHLHIAAVPWTYISGVCAPDGALVQAAPEPEMLLHSTRPPKRARQRAQDDAATPADNDDDDDDADDDDDGGDEDDDDGGASASASSSAASGSSQASAAPVADPPTAAEFHHWIAGGVDSAVIVTASHPLEAVLAATRIVRPGGQIAVFSITPAPLAEVASALRGEGICRDVRVQSLFLREQQIMPSATHPMMNMHAASGYLLSGQVVVHPYLAVRPQVKDLSKSAAPDSKRKPSTAPVAISVPPPN
jgi:hypothetical protein